jgi:hypothetical protein
MVSGDIRDHDIGTVLKWAVRERLVGSLPHDDLMPTGYLLEPFHVLWDMPEKVIVHANGIVFSNCYYD